MNENSLDIWRTLMEKGTSKLGQAEYKIAESYFSRSLKVADTLAVPVIKAFNLRLLATAQIKQGKTELAERGFRKALRICEEISNLKGISEALAGLASVAVEMNNPEAAIVWFKRAIEVYPDASPQLRLAMLYSDLGQVYATLEQWKEAQVTYGSAMELCHQYGYPKGEGELSVLIGEACFRQGDKIGARTFLIRACRIFALIKEHNSLINALQYLAFMYFEQEEYEEARQSLNRAVVLQIQYALWDEVSESSYFLTKILQELELLEEASYYMELTLQLYKQKDISFALRLQSMGKLMSSKQDFIEAKKYLKESAALFEYFGDDLRLGECYEHLAYLAGRLGEEEEAIRYRQESTRMIAGHNAVSLSAVHKLAEYYEQRHNYWDALRCYWQSLQIAREIGYETKEIERAVQRVSKYVRKKKRF
jgi:tetratricopeptide (TPR) repeat protein